MARPKSEDFTIATTILNDDLIATLATIVGREPDDTATLTASDLRDVLNDHSLSAVEIEAVFVGLILNKAADRAGDASSLTEDVLIVDVDRAQSVLTEQAAVRRALDSRTANPSPRDDSVQPSSDDDRSTLVATVPQELKVEVPDSVDDLDARLRAAMLEAEDTVRVATPYFDPGHPTVEALYGLPQRGITTRILTRRVEPGTDRYELLNAMIETLDTDDRKHLDIAELFAEDEYGRQAYSTHAKMVIVDETTCYLGSANFTATNLSSNFEVGVITSSSDTAVATRLFDEVFAASHRVPNSRFR